MRILFCNIAWMKEYRGNEDGKDTPLMVEDMLMRQEMPMKNIILHQ